ncbi:hypothetical protein [Deinococcus kurensis]|uniref:hypothetical protein n=1 Tax=Deinococcus kurensis TaxID=2662757 RepID=UPI0012D34383|nr:hypothetical protein [Deinococcus kurensis]
MPDTLGQPLFGKTARLDLTETLLRGAFQVPSAQAASALGVTPARPLTVAAAGAYKPARPAFTWAGLLMTGAFPREWRGAYQAAPFRAFPADPAPPSTALVPARARTAGTGTLAFREDLPADLTVAAAPLGAAPAQSGQSASANFDSMTLGSAPTGWTGPHAPWTVVSSASGRGVRVNWTGGAACLLLNNVTIAGARFLQVDMQVSEAGNNDPHPGLTVAYQDASNYDAIYWRSSTGEVVWWQVRGGSSSAIVIGSSAAIQNLWAQPVTLRVDISAQNVVTAFRLGGYAAAPSVGMQLIAGGQMGLWQHRSSGASGWSDNFLAQSTDVIADPFRVTGLPDGAVLVGMGFSDRLAAADGGVATISATGLTEAYVALAQGGLIRLTGVRSGTYALRARALRAVDSGRGVDAGDGPWLTRRAAGLIYDAQRDDLRYALDSGHRNGVLWRDELGALQMRTFAPGARRVALTVRPFDEEGDVLVRAALSSVEVAAPLAVGLNMAGLHLVGWPSWRAASLDGGPSLSGGGGTLPGVHALTNLRGVRRVGLIDAATHKWQSVLLEDGGLGGARDGADGKLIIETGDNGTGTGTWRELLATRGDRVRLIGFTRGWKVSSDQTGEVPAAGGVLELASLAGRFTRVRLTAPDGQAVVQRATWYGGDVFTHPSVDRFRRVGPPRRARRSLRGAPAPAAADWVNAVGGAVQVPAAVVQGPVLRVTGFTQQQVRAVSLGAAPAAPFRATVTLGGGDQGGGLGLLRPDGSVLIGSVLYLNTNWTHRFWDGQMVFNSNGTAGTQVTIEQTDTELVLTDVNGQWRYPHAPEAGLRWAVMTGDRLGNLDATPVLESRAPLAVTTPAGTARVTWGGVAWTPEQVRYPDGAQGFELIAYSADEQILAYELSAQPGEQWTLVRERALTGADSASLTDRATRCRVVTGEWSGVWDGAYAAALVDCVSTTDAWTGGPRSLTRADVAAAQELRFTTYGVLKARGDVGYASEAGRRATARPLGLDTGRGGDVGRMQPTRFARLDAGAAAERAALSARRGADVGTLTEPGGTWTPAQLTGVHLADPARWSSAAAYRPVVTRTPTTVSLDASTYPGAYPYNGDSAWTALTLGAHPFKVTVTLQADGGLGVNGAHVGIYAGGAALAWVTEYQGGFTSWGVQGGGSFTGYASSEWPAQVTIEQTATELILTTRNGTRRATRALGGAQLVLGLTDRGGRAVFQDLQVQGVSQLQRHRYVAGADAGQGAEGALVYFRGARERLTGLDAAQVLRVRPLARADAGTLADAGRQGRVNFRGVDAVGSFDGRAILRRNARVGADAGTFQESRARSTRGGQDAAVAAELLSLRRGRFLTRAEDPVGADRGARTLTNPRGADAGQGTDRGVWATARPVGLDTARATEGRVIHRLGVRLGADTGQLLDAAVMRQRGGQEAIFADDQGALLRHLSRVRVDAGAAGEAGKRAAATPVAADYLGGLDVGGIRRVRTLTRLDAAVGLDVGLGVGRGGQPDLGTGADVGAVTRHVRRATQDSVTGGDAGVRTRARNVLTDPGRAAEGRVLARVMRLTGQDAGYGADRGRRLRRGGEDPAWAADAARIYRRNRRDLRDAAQLWDSGVVVRDHHVILDTGTFTDARTGLLRRGERLIEDYGGMQEAAVRFTRGGDEVVRASDRVRAAKVNFTQFVELSLLRDAGRVTKVNAPRGLDAAVGAERAKVKPRGAQYDLRGVDAGRVLRRNRAFRAEDATAVDAALVSASRVHRIEGAVVGELVELRRVKRLFSRDSGVTADLGAMRSRGGDDRARGTTYGDATRLNRRWRQEDVQTDESGTIRYNRRALTRPDAAGSRERATRTTSTPRVRDAGAARERYSGNRTVTRRDAAHGTDGGRLRGIGDALDAGEVLAAPRGWDWRPEVSVVPGPRAVRDTSGGVVRYPWAAWVTYEGTPYMARGDLATQSWADTDAQVIEGVDAYALHLSLAWDQNAERVAAWHTHPGSVTVSWVNLTPGRAVQRLTFPGVDPALFSEARVTPVEAGTDVVLFYLDEARTRVLYRLQVEGYARERVFGTLPRAGVHLDQALDDGSSVLLAFGDRGRTSLTMQAGPYAQGLQDAAQLLAAPKLSLHAKVREVLTVPNVMDAITPVAEPLGGVYWRAANPPNLRWTDLAYVTARPLRGAHLYTRTIRDLPVLTDNPRPADTGTGGTQQGRTDFASVKAAAHAGRDWWTTHQIPAYTHAVKITAVTPAGGVHEEVS